MTENYCEFTIFITDPSGKNGLVIEATSMDTEARYNSITVSEDVTKLTEVHRFERKIQCYSGPDFNTLDERIQNGVIEYLESFGVNENLCAFIECMSLDKD